MFPLQQKIQDDLSELERLLAKYELTPPNLTEMSSLLLKFKMRVPLVGAFSAGKSTLLNALLGDKLLSVAVNPETSLATELHYDNKEIIQGYLPDGSVKKITRKELLQQEFGSLIPNGWVEVRTPSSALKNYPHICLVDMPGLDSGLQSHALAIDNYINRSLAYCIVMSADDGALHKTTRDFLQELAQLNAPVIAIITKGDKRNESDLENITEGFKQELHQLLGKNPFCIMAVSARKNRIEPFLNALADLESQAEQRFRDTVGAKFLGLLSTAAEKLTVLLNEKDYDSDELRRQGRELEQEMQQFRMRLDRETDALQSQIEGILGQIMSLVESRLRSQIDGLANIILNQGDLNVPVSQTVRLALVEGIQRDFAPRIQHYVSRVESELPDVVRLHNQFNFEDAGGGFDSGLISTALTGIVATLLKKFPIVALLMPVIKHLIGLFLEEKQRSIDSNRRLEQAKGYVLNSVIPTVMQQVSGSVRQHLLQQIESARVQIGEAVKVRAEQHAAALCELEKLLQAGQISFAKKQQEYRADFDQINTMRKEWEKS